jgi:hypothetical protein
MDLSTQFAVANDSFFNATIESRSSGVLSIDRSGLSGAPAIALGVHIFGCEAYRKFASD